MINIDDAMMRFVTMMMFFLHARIEPKHDLSIKIHASSPANINM